MENILELQQVSKTFSKSNFALENVTFSLPYGSIMGFVGENGAGKTNGRKGLFSGWQNVRCRASCCAMESSGMNLRGKTTPFRNTSRSWQINSWRSSMTRNTPVFTSCRNQLNKEESKRWKISKTRMK